MNSQFILNYMGTKYKETDKIKDFDYKGYTSIVEPFCGSYGFSRYLYRVLDLKHLKFYLYDNDKDLIDFYKHMKQLKSENKLNDFIDKYNNMLTNIFTEDKLIKKGTYNKKEILKINIEDKYLKFIFDKNCFARGVCKKNPKTKIDKSFLDMLDNCTFIHKSSINNKFEEVEDIDKALIYLDPPYIFSCNTKYSNVDDDYTVYIDYCFKTFKNVMFVHDYHFLLNAYFKDYIKHEYSKKYGLTGNNKQHIVYYKSNM